MVAFRTVMLVQMWWRDAGVVAFRNGADVAQV